MRSTSESALSQHPVARAQERDRRHERKLRAELGAAVLDALRDPSVIEVLVNPPARAGDACALWIEFLEGGMRDTGVRMSAVQVENVICSVAALLDRVASRAQPIVECELPFDGSRFEGFLPPVVPAPAFVIRKRALLVFSLEDYVHEGFMSPTECQAIREAIRRRENLLISGGTGTGKTTLINAVLKEMALLGKPAERFVILEDTPEIQCEAPNALQLRTSAEVDMPALLRATLRARPDRIIIGEARGREALSLVKAWGTGHPGGVASIHANSARDALERLDQLIQENPVPSQASLIARTIDWVLHLERTASGRRVKELLRVRGHDQAKREYRFEPIG